MHVLNPLQANRLGPARLQNIQELKVCTQESPVCPRMYPSESRAIQYQISYTASGILTTWTRIGKTVHTCLNMVQTCSDSFMKSWTCMYMYVHEHKYAYIVCSMYIHVHDFIRLYMHVHDFIYLYVHGTYMFMYVNRCMDIIQTRLYSFKTTLHFPSS